MSGSDEPSVFTVGERVRVSRLVFRPDLNGTTSVVLKPLDANDRICVAYFLKPLSVRPENLMRVPSDEPTDWIINDDRRGPWCLVENCRRTPLGDIDECDKFVVAVSLVLALSGAPMQQQHFDCTVGCEGEDMLRRILLNNTRDHLVFMLRFEPIAHYLVLETRHGRGRVLQAWVKTTSDEVAGEIGYSAREWVSPQPPKGAMPMYAAQLAAAHACWGGGRELDWLEMREFVGLCFELQRGAEAITESLLQQLPPHVRDEERRWHAAILAGRPIPEMEQGAQFPVREWACQQMAEPAYPSNVTCDGLHVYSNRRQVGAPFRLRLDPALVKPYVSAHLAVTEMPPPGCSYLQMLQQKNWRREFAPPDTPGGALRASGWVVNVARALEPEP